MNPYSNPLALLEYLSNLSDVQEDIPPEFDKIFKENFDELLSSQPNKDALEDKNEKD